MGVWGNYVARLMCALLASSGRSCVYIVVTRCEFWRVSLGGWLEDLDFGRRRG